MPKSLRTLRPKVHEQILEADAVILVYDGTCGACSRWVRFLINENRKENLYFASTASPMGTLIRQVSKTAKFFLLTADGTLLDSDAVLYALGQCRSPLRWLHHLQKIPRVFRDSVVRFVANCLRKANYKLTKPCNRPEQNLQGRILWEKTVFKKNDS